MKKAKLFLMLLISIAASSCVFFGKDEPLDPSKFTCYIAINKSDTAWLDIDTSERKIKGLFTMSYGGKKKLHGQLKGTIKGDTLNAHYDFKVNKVDKWYRNPVSFLRKDNQLVMGVGEIVMVWGSGVFKEGVPVDYDKGRFVFERTVCKY
jgi:hypothetical protein